MTEVTVTLTSDEALVLFELLHRWEDSGELATVLMPQFIWAFGEGAVPTP